MKTAGIRQARQALSVLLADVGQGHEIVITDRGRPVARLVPPLRLSLKPFASRAAVRRRTRQLRVPPAAPAVRVRWSRALPGPLYVGPNVLLKLYRPEPDSDALDRALQGRRDLTVSDLTVTEVLAMALASARAPVHLGPLPQVLQDDLESGMYRRVEIVPATHRAAERLLVSGAARRVGHALHLALAMTAGVAGLLTVDAELAAAARAVGLPVLP